MGTAAKRTQQPQANASGRGTVARDAFYLVLGQVTTTALAIVFSAALGRTLAYVPVDWGQQFYVIREVAWAPERGSELLGTWNPGPGPVFRVPARLR